MGRLRVLRGQEPELPGSEVTQCYFWCILLVKASYKAPSLDRVACRGLVAVLSLHVWITTLTL